MVDLVTSNLQTTLKRAYQDPSLKKDHRILKNFLQSEERYLPSSNYFTCVQKHLQPYMRKIVTSWMFDVVTELNCGPSVFPLAVNLVDRYLSIQSIHHTQFQVLAAAAMFVASKLRECDHIPAHKLIIYTDNSIKLENLLNWELRLLSQLRWDICAVTVYDFLDILLIRLNIDPGLLESLRTTFPTLINMSTKDHNFLIYSPSMISAASILVVMKHTCSDHYFRHIASQIQKITSIDMDVLRPCQEQMEQVARQELMTNKSSPTGNSQCGCPNGSEFNATKTQPLTPTDVLGVSATF